MDFSLKWAQTPEKAMELAIDTLKQAGKPVSKAAVARMVGLRREPISRRYPHCFEKAS
ncbi:hypothetical protein [Vibrio hyugaensis]|uniref:hypothetical protein n=1 Tax=Vibrio hyugaensis TaxID=1534743 RepID=UPI0012E04D5F|nr:hypothetical protein [Vibrio hyugaensis]